MMDRTSNSSTNKPRHAMQDDGENKKYKHSDTGDILIPNNHNASSQSGDSSHATDDTNPNRYQQTTKYKRRYCRVPGCNSVVKSQGCCQKHGAKPKQCRIHGCVKQAQGSFDGMCSKLFIHFY